MLDVLSTLLDPNNKDPIVLADEKGGSLVFEQVAVLPYEVEGCKQLYVVLKPLGKMEGIADDEAIVFKVVLDENGNASFIVEDNELVAIEVFNKYYDLFEEKCKSESKKPKKNRKGGAT